MILYKYVSMETGRKIVDGGAIQFTQPRYFNDPFDMPFYPNEPAADPVSEIFAGLRTMVKNTVWAESSGILSLTRTPENALMWAHYAEKHQGVVVGIDAVAAGFTEEASNLIPAQFGSVIYVSRRDIGPFISAPQKGIAVGATHAFPIDHYEKLQRVFLHKPLTWSYEEEVRVVKSLHGLSYEHVKTQSGDFDVKNRDGRDIHLYTLPKSSICELYVGIRADQEKADALVALARERHPHITARECVLDTNAMTVGHRPYESVAEAIAGVNSDTIAGVNE